MAIAVTAYIHSHYPEVKVVNIALPDAYVEHGNVSLLRKGLGIDSDSIIRRLKEEGWLSGIHREENGEERQRPSE